MNDQTPTAEKTAEQDAGVQLGLKPIETPVTIVIFGASGDLTGRKLLPAIYAMHREGMLPECFTLVGVARRPKSDDEFRDEMREGVREFGRVSLDESDWVEFAKNMSYVAGDLDDPGTYEKLSKSLSECESSSKSVRLYYLAVPPSVFPTALQHLSQSGLSRTATDTRTRIIIEKPFGHDLESARALDEQVHGAFTEDQVFRIDHYLGKETVQNILVFRLANGIFEPTWNRRYIDHVQITVAESIGVEDRGRYFDHAGVLRDIVQNHMLQLLCLVAMEPPARFNAEMVRNEKVKVLMALNTLTEPELRTAVVRGQYSEGEVGGQRVPGYRSEANIAPHSTTETFVAFRAYLDNWRWAGVPFYLRAGKRLKTRSTEIVIHFRHPPLALFGYEHGRQPAENKLILQIQPDEGISLSIGSKRPGDGFKIDPVQLDFRYKEAFDRGPRDAYERLLLDAVKGDSTLFAREDEVDRAWRFVTPILDAWRQTEDCPVHPYWAGSWGPEAADRLMQADGRAWHNEVPGD